ncbi:MAG TPA: AAA family ATPase [Actinomycetes bacterium]|nr:AAA family ATPase [Actinomycetes bacterium]
MTVSAPRLSPLVGRSEELAALSSLVGLDGAPPGAVLVSGDAGVGKTRLLHELRLRAVAAGRLVLVGHCVDFGDGGLPYLPFSDAFGRLEADAPELAEQLLAAAPGVAPLLPSHRRGVGAATGERTERGSLFEAVEAALAHLGSLQPTLIVVEDLHWADQSSRDLLSFLFARGVPAGVALVVSYRSDDLHRRHPLRTTLSEWNRLPTLSRVALGPLDDADVRRLVELLHSDPMPDSAVTSLLARADGNAFFVEELVSAAEGGAASLPADLADLLLVRIERLDDDARAIVRAASVAGRRVTHPVLAAVAALEPERLDRALRAAVDANVLLAAGTDDRAGYAFRHALLAEAVYDDLLPGERVRLHAAYAKVLAELGGTSVELARHARAAHDVATAVRAGIRAGDEAMAVGGPDEAVRSYELALELLAEPDGQRLDVDVVDLTLRAAEAAAAAGHLFRGLALVEDALDALPDDAPEHDRARLLLGVATIGLLGDTGVDVLALTTQAVALVASSPSTELHARILLAHARALEERGRDDQGARWVDEALQLSRTLEVADVAVDASTLIARIERRRGDPEASLALLEASVAEARATGEVGAELRSLFSLAGLLYERGELARARETYAAAADLARRSGRAWAPYGIDARALAAIVAQVQGEWDEARRIVDVTGEAPPAMAEAMLAAVDVGVLAWRGSNRALELQPALRPWWSRDGFVAILAGGAAIEAHTARGDAAAALRAYEEVVAAVSTVWKREGFAAQVRLAALALAALTVQAREATARERTAIVEHGERLAAEAAVAAGTWKSRGAGVEGRAWTMRVEAERLRLHWSAGVDPPDADQLVTAWRAALAGFEEFGNVFEVARCQVRLAEALRGTGEAGEAAALLATAGLTADALGARPLLAEIRLAGGARTRSASEHPEEQLTPREREVLALIASGRSNREIAGRLFISAKTVSVHVSNILAKLGAGGRTEAVAVARRRGLLEDSP